MENLVAVAPDLETATVTVTADRVRVVFDHEDLPDIIQMDFTADQARYLAELLFKAGDKLADGRPRGRTAQELWHYAKAHPEELTDIS